MNNKENVVSCASERNDELLFNDGANMIRPTMVTSISGTIGDGPAPPPPPIFFVSGGDDFWVVSRLVQSDSSGGGLWEKWKSKTAEMSAKAAKLGLSAVLAYGLFDAVTYTTFFVLTFLGYEKSTGKNPAANLQALLGIVILMWSGNNVTRPFRVAGAAALAPFIDKGLKKIQKFFNLPSLAFAFGLVVSVVAVLCLSIVGLLILSRWGR
ncbi:hypothetical protein QJS04_geneDACA012216 [Acorus gramineus]|uniref:Uncharacterized protein n=1 Tax=Acorus gramineus TaxID=55184 RepID=A0AAV9BAM3_ACOGR|nr:hypothetical protein QJS04_geneDACA012216 [Acorus gramineus]